MCLFGGNIFLIKWKKWIHLDKWNKIDLIKPNALVEIRAMILDNLAVISVIYLWPVLAFHKAVWL